jgi:hypothetical protein
LSKLKGNKMTIDEVFSAAAERGLSVKRWGGSRLLTYNGFTHEQRVRKWQALDLAIRMGLESPAEEFPCSVCGVEPSSSIAYHSEDYGSMGSASARTGPKPAGQAWAFAVGPREVYHDI